MSRTRIVVIAAVVLALLAAGVGWYMWWQESARQQAQREVAGRVAASISALTLNDADFSDTVGVSPAAEFAAITKNMGGLKPVVNVKSVGPGDRGDQAKAVLAYEWRPSEQLPSWTYETNLLLGNVSGVWKANWQPSVVAPGLGVNEILVYSRLQPARGAIVGAGGTSIASNQPAAKVSLVKSGLDATAADKAARALAGVLQIDADGFAQRVAASGPSASVEAANLRLNDPQQQKLVAAVRSMPSVDVKNVTLPLAISSSFARPLLGFVGPATAEQLEKDPSLREGDFVGIGGVQAAFESTLRGSAGYAVHVKEPGADHYRDLTRVDAKPGTDLNLTIDVRLQAAAEEVLASVGPPSAIVAIRPSDGQLLVVASGPGSKGYPTATLGQYTPGSTFKIVSGLGMLREGLTPESPVPCTDTFTVQGTVFHNYDGYPASKLGTIPWKTAFAESCNTAVLAQADKVTQAELAEAAAALGLTGDAKLGVSAVLGRVPEQAAHTTEHTASMIGLGNVKASPLGMASVVASVAKGEAVRPVLVPGTSDPGTAVAKPLTAGESDHLRALMRAVAVDGGATAALAGTPGGDIMAKTGTAPYDKASGKGFHTWIVAIQGDLAVAVVVEDGQTGAKTAGPLLKAFLTKRAG